MVSSQDAPAGALASGLHLKLGSEPADLAHLMRWLVAAFEAANVSAATSNAVQIALDEAFANVLEHGLLMAKPIKVEIDMRAEGDRLAVTITDDGAAFDPTKIAEPRLATSLEDARIGGLGIHFIRTLSTAMAYERLAGRNRLRLEFPLTYGASLDKPVKTEG